MATDPDSDHVFTADFNQLSGIVQRIKDKACRGVCKAKVDLGFLLDASASIEYSDKDNFQKCLDFHRSNGASI
ncbi:hypothetical protein QZH41_020682 [Actinostola sp. cb2023]|nr:hypothetical protein QZH41_020682 [Actinostola sp. cb2023]